jgi:hypothetical protein
MRSPAAFSHTKQNPSSLSKAKDLSSLAPSFERGSLRLASPIEPIVIPIGVARLSLSRAFCATDHAAEGDLLLLLVVVVGGLAVAQKRKRLST